MPYELQVFKVVSGQEMDFNLFFSASNAAQAFMSLSPEVGSTVRASRSPCFCGLPLHCRDVHAWILLDPCALLPVELLFDPLIVLSALTSGPTFIADFFIVPNVHGSPQARTFALHLI